MVRVGSSEKLLTFDQATEPDIQKLITFYHTTEPDIQKPVISKFAGVRTSNLTQLIDP
jgi:hypothetical protein